MPEEYNMTYKHVNNTQANISGLETNPNSAGSLLTVQLAMACGVRPEWLAMEEGPMVNEYSFRPDSPSWMLYRVSDFRD